jgi:hypothetical protein
MTSKHRTNLSGIPAMETEKWGRGKARELAGEPKYFNGAPQPSGKLQRPQSPEDRHAPGYDNDHRNDWVRGRNEDGAPPQFDRLRGRNK